MKKLGKVFSLIPVLLLCIAWVTLSASAVFPGLSGFPSTISEGSVWLIAGIAVVVIAVAVILIVKKTKAKKKEGNKE